MATPTWFQIMNSSLSKIERSADGDIPLEAYCAAIAEIPGIYEALFGMIPMAVSTLKGDIDNGVLRVRNAAKACPEGKGESLFKMCTHLLDTVGNDAVRNDNTSGVRCLLWLNRATTFITQLIRGILEGKEPHVAADNAYVTYLQPYHGYVMGKLVQNIMYGAPPKEKMFSLLNLESEESAKAQMSEFVAYMEPLTQAILAYMDKNQCNWPDTA